MNVEGMAPPKGEALKEFVSFVYCSATNRATHISFYTPRVWILQNWRSCVLPGLRIWFLMKGVRNGKLDPTIGRDEGESTSF